MGVLQLRKRQFGSSLNVRGLSAAGSARLAKSGLAGGWLQLAFAVNSGSSRSQEDGQSVSGLRRFFFYRPHAKKFGHQIMNPTPD